MFVQGQHSFSGGAYQNSLKNKTTVEPVLRGHLAIPQGCPLNTGSTVPLSKTISSKNMD